MDSVTQVVLGGAVGYAVLGDKVGRKAALYGAVLGTLPDLDVFLPYGGEVE
ncbi:MAG: metal-dependent hydrolase, partial [Bermanella sp.]